MRVWDLPTRAFHWVLAACVLASLVSAWIGGNAMVWHLRFGYVVFTLLLFRLLWGFVGGHWSRFASFVVLAGHQPALPARPEPPDEHHHVGHNPLGAFSVFGLLLLLAAAGRHRPVRRRRDRDHRAAEQVRLGQDGRQPDLVAHDASASG